MTYPSFGTYLSGIASAPVNIVCDLILVISFLIFLIYGTKTGFIKLTFGLLRPIGSIVIAIFCCQAVGKYIYDIGLLDGLVDYIQDTILSIVQQPDFAASHDGQTFQGFTGVLGMLFAMSGNDELAARLSGLVAGNADVIRELSSDVVSGAAVVVAFVVLLLLGGLVIKIVAGILNLIFRLPGLNIVNGFFGFVVGAFLGAIFCWLFSFVIYFLVTWLGSSTGSEFFLAFGQGEGTYLEQLLFNFNPLRFALESLEQAMIFS